jgi:hypothetical protein
MQDSEIDLHGVENAKEAMNQQQAAMEKQQAAMKVTRAALTERD